MGIAGEERLEVRGGVVGLAVREEGFAAGGKERGAQFGGLKIAADAEDHAARLVRTFAQAGDFAFEINPAGVDDEIGFVTKKFIDPRGLGGVGWGGDFAGGLDGGFRARRDLGDEREGVFDRFVVDAGDVGLGEFDEGASGFVELAEAGVGLGDAVHPGEAAGVAGAGGEGFLKEGGQPGPVALLFEERGRLVQRIGEDLVVAGRAGGEAVGFDGFVGFAGAAEHVTAEGEHVAHLGVIAEVLQPVLAQPEGFVPVLAAVGADGEPVAGVGIVFGVRIRLDVGFEFFGRRVDVAGKKDDEGAAIVHVLDAGAAGEKGAEAGVGGTCGVPVVGGKIGVSELEEGGLGLQVVGGNIVGDRGEQLDGGGGVTAFEGGVAGGEGHVEAFGRGRVFCEIFAA